MANKAEYSRLQAEVRRNSTEMLRQFKEQNPERFAELEAQAKREANEPAQPRPVVTHTAIRTRAYTTDELDAILFPPHMREYFVRAQDKWGDTRTFFESFPPAEIDDIDILAVVSSKHPRHTLVSLISVEPCTCPACRRRHDDS